MQLGDNDSQEEIYSEENENGRGPYDSYSSGDDYMITESEILSKENLPEGHYTDEVTFSGFYPDTQLVTEQSGPYPSPTESFFAARDVTTITTRIPYHRQTTPSENEDSLPAPDLSYQDEGIHLFAYILQLRKNRTNCTDFHHFRILDHYIATGISVTLLVLR